MVEDLASKSFVVVRGPGTHACTYVFRAIDGIRLDHRLYAWAFGH
jgi:hypothetical protein